MAQETPQQAEQKHIEQTDTLTIPSWLASVVALGSVLAQSGFRPTHDDVNEFAAVFGLTLIILSTVIVALSPARSRVHCTTLLWLWSGIGAWIILWRVLSQSQVVTNTDARFFTGWGYVGWDCLLVIGVNRLRIRRWLTKS